MGRFRVYINPFDDSGNYTSFQEITPDVDMKALKSISEKTDNTDFDIGIYRNNKFNLKVNNIDGKYSDVGVANSIFRFTRSNSKVKISASCSTP